MKKIIALLLVLLLVFAFCVGCNSPDDNTVSDLERAKSNFCDGLNGDLNIIYDEVENEFTDKRLAWVFAYWQQAYREELRERCEAANSIEEVSELDLESRRMRLKMLRCCRSDTRLLDSRINIVFSGEIDGEQFSVCYERVTATSSDFTLSVGGEVEGLTFRVYRASTDSLSEVKNVPGTSIKNPTEQYCGVILCKNEAVRGYVVSDYADTWNKAVVFDLEEGQEVSENEAIELMRKAKNGLDGESLLNVGVITCSQVNYAEFGDWVEPIGFGVAGGNPSINIYDYESSLEGEIEYELQSSVECTIDGASVTKARVYPGDTVYWSNESGSDGYVGITVKQNGEIVCVRVIRITAKRYGDRVAYSFFLRGGEVKYTASTPSSEYAYESLPDGFISALIRFWGSNAGV